MPFGNLSTLFVPTAANAGASQWGTDVRRLRDVADSAADTTTVTDHGTNGNPQVRTVDPYSTTTDDLDQTLYGFAVAPSDMGSVAGARRFYPAGNHSLTVRVSHNGATSSNANLILYVYRVGPSPGRTRTLLGSATGPTFSLPALSGEVDATVTVALGEIIFEPDETIQYSWELSAVGIAIAGHTVTHILGTATAGTVSRLNTPRLGVLADTTGTVTSGATVSGTGGKVLGTVGSSAGIGSVAGVGASQAASTGAASGSAVVAGQASSLAGTTGSASGSSVTSGIGGKVIGSVGTVQIGSTEAPVIYRPLIISVED